MKQTATALIVVAALLATSRPVREADPMLTLETPLIFFAVEIITDFKNIPKFPTLPAEDDK
jgi:hypothetical protein